MNEEFPEPLIPQQFAERPRCKNHGGVKDIFDMIADGDYESETEHWESGQPCPCCGNMPGRIPLSAGEGPFAYGDAADYCTECDGWLDG